MATGAVAGRTAQRVHRDLDGAVQFPGVGLVDLFLQLALFGDQRVHLLGRQILGETGADFLEAVEQRLGRGQPLHDVAGDVLVRVERRLLRQIADRGALGGPGLAREIALLAGHDPQQRRFAGAVEAEHADLGAGEKRQPDVAQHLAAAGIGFSQTFHDVDVLVGGHFLCFVANWGMGPGVKSARRRVKPILPPLGHPRIRIARTRRKSRAACGCRGQLVRSRALAEHGPDRMSAVFWLIDTIIDIYIWLLIAQAILSWLVAFGVVNRWNRGVAVIGDFLYRVTEPLLRPIRSFLPNFGGIDISPVILILLLMFLRRLILYDLVPALSEIPARCRLRRR